MLRLYHDWDSFASFKVRIALEEKAVSWDSQIVSLGQFEHLRPEFLALNPNGLVPALAHDATVLAESSVILEYLDDILPQPALRPVDAAGKARVRSWMHYSADTVHQAVRPPTFHLMIKTKFAGLPADEMRKLVANHPNPKRAAAYREWAAGDVDFPAVIDAMRALRTVFERMENTLRRTTWLAGDAFSLADIAVAPLIDRVEHLRLEFLWEDCPHVRRWIAEVTTRPSYRISAPPEGTRLPSPGDDIIAKLRQRWVGCEVTR